MPNAYYNPFAGSSADKTVYIGRNIANAENYAPFANTTTVEFGDKVTKVKNSLFSGAKKLYSVTIGSGVTTIENSAFQGAGTDDGVGELVVTMGANVTTIGNNAFNGCSKLWGITLPSTLTYVGEQAFNYCSSLASIAI